MPVNLKTQLRQLILTEALKSVQDPGKYKVLVCDPHSMKCLFNVCTKEQRATETRQEAIYLITPTRNVIDAIINDLSGPKRMYTGAHIFSIAALPDNLFDRLKTGAAAYIKNLKELNIDFTPLKRMYSPSNIEDLDGSLEDMADQLISVFTTLGDSPVIRYFDPSGNRDSLAARAAVKIQAAIDKYRDLEPDWPPKSPYPPAQLLVLDRSVDVFSPLLHSFTYQAAVFDLLQVDLDKVEV
ncbi:Sec1-like protein, partial [Blyttiomyces helicus]